MIGGGSVNGGTSGPGLFWGFGSEEGSSGIGIFTMKYESLGQVSGAGKVTMIRARLRFHLTEDTEPSFLDA